MDFLGGKRSAIGEIALMKRRFRVVNRVAVSRYGATRDDEVSTLFSFDSPDVSIRLFSTISCLIRLSGKKLKKVEMENGSTAMTAETNSSEVRSRKGKNILSMFLCTFVKR